MTWRKFDALLSGLPPGSAYIRAVRPELAWNENEHLLAHIADLLAGGNWQRSGGKGQRPKPIKRPGAEEATFGQGPGHTVEELNAMGITSG